MKRPLALALVLAAPVAVLADDMGGPQAWGKMLLLGLVLAAAIVLVIQVVVLLIEALIYRMALPIGAGRAFGVSAVANLASFSAGLLTAPIPIGWSKGGLYGRAAIAAFNIGLTLIIEVPIVLAMTRKIWRSDESGALQRRFLRTAIWANIATCGALHLALLLF